MAKNANSCQNGIAQNGYTLLIFNQIIWYMCVVRYSSLLQNSLSRKLPITFIQSEMKSNSMKMIKCCALRCECGRIVYVVVTSLLGIPIPVCHKTDKQIEMCFFACRILYAVFFILPPSPYLAWKRRKKRVKTCTAANDSDN